MINLLDIERVVFLATSYRKQRKDFARLSDKSTGDMTPKQREKSNADLAWAAMAMVRLEATLHAACVDAGLADLRDAGAYAPRALRGTGHHQLSFEPDLPRAFSDREASIATIRAAALDELGALDADLLSCPCGQPTNNGGARCGSCEAEHRAELADNARQRMREGL